MTKVLVFDFDGVLVPSEEIKVRAYELIFTEFGEKVAAEDVKSARQEFSNARGNRFDIIRSILKKRNTPENKLETAVAQYGERYGSIVRKQLNAFKVEKNVIESLERWSRVMPLYINSNNPDDFLKEMLESLKLTKYFKGIFGSSRKKAENLAEIARIESIQPKEILFVGDGEGDWDAAEQFGCEFVGIPTSLNEWSEARSSFRLARSFSEILQENDRIGERMV